MTTHKTTPIASGDLSGIEFLSALGRARRWWWLLLGVTILGTLVAGATAERLAPTYRATATILVLDGRDAALLAPTDPETSERLANTINNLILIRPVMERAITEGGLPYTSKQLEQRITIRKPASSSLLEISAQASEAVLAASIANHVAAASIAWNQEALGQRPGTVTIVEPAEPPDGRIAPATPLAAGLIAVLPLFVATLGMVVLIEYLDDTLQSSEEAIAITGLPLLGQIERFRKSWSAREQLLAASRPGSEIAEQHRATRTNLSYTLDPRTDCPLILVTSAGPGEGTTTTVGNIAMVFGLAGHRVCIVDSNLRRPMQHGLFGLGNQYGLASLLLDKEADIDRATQRSTFANVSVITSGPPPLNPSELLGGRRLEEVLDHLRKRFDVVFLDSPPVLIATDASVLAPVADVTFLVASINHTRTLHLRTAVEEVARSGRPIAGLVMNRVLQQDLHGYQYEWQTRASRRSQPKGA